ncbi:MAG: putative nucleotidyltransferase substrate binding domain protein [Bacteroidetes bacterium ADurb.Bin408]|nr:MAG: putative nucleotidyltransferase substrate binding domain protein [Bacteroidetes bacterium ADurb.Bin408]
MGNILLETAGAPPETVNIKETLMPIVNFARIYALKQRCKEAGTLQRLSCIYKENVLNPSTYVNILQAFEYLNQVRLKHQADL